MTIRVGAIQGVENFSLKRTHDSLGAMFHVMEEGDYFWMSIGRVYCSYIKPGVVKGWSRYANSTLNYVAPNGLVEIILFDDRKNSPTRYRKQILNIGAVGTYSLVRVPSGIWTAYRSKLKYRGALLVNIADRPYQASEVLQLAPEKLRYEKQLVHDWRFLDA